MTQFNAASMRFRSTILILLLFAIGYTAVGKWSFASEQDSTRASQPYEKSSEQEEKQDSFEEDLEDGEVWCGLAACHLPTKFPLHSGLTLECNSVAQVVQLDLVSARPPPVEFLLFS